MCGGTYRPHRSQTHRIIYATAGKFRRAERKNREVSQYPTPPQPPYAPPPLGYGAGGYYPAFDPLAAFKKAGAMMFVFAALGLVCGGCLFATSQVPAEQLPPETQLQLERQASEAGATVAQFYAVMRGGGVVGLVVGGLYVVLGIFVRRGSRGAAGWGIALTGLITAGLLIYLLLALAAVGAADPGQVALGAGFLLATIGVLAVLIVFLVRAIKSAPQAANLQQQYQQQYYQYVQQQQAYGQQPPAYGAQQGYGYGQGQGYAGPPPPPPPDSTPHSPRAGEHSGGSGAAPPPVPPVG